MFTYDTHPQKAVKSSDFSGSIQRKQTAANSLFDSDDRQFSRLRSENNTSPSDDPKAGKENVSGISPDGVKMQCNSFQPAQFRAFAYTQGTNTNVAPAQQKQNGFKPTGLLKRVGINNGERPERETDVIERKSMASSNIHNTQVRSSTVQCETWKTPSLVRQTEKIGSKKGKNKKQTKDIAPKDKKNDGYINTDPLQQAIHHMLPRDLVKEFWHCLSEK